MLTPYASQWSAAPKIINFFFVWKHISFSGIETIYEGDIGAENAALWN
jgi:hypothetical protein